ncbi:MAG: DNA-binding protein [Bacteroidetes bacterium 43-16]|nr:MAG: DNA-binding protein [Bacteroidetes bacterium 43-16]
MEKQKIFFKENLKLLRERKQYSQETLAGKLGYTRAKIAALESGHTKSPQPEDYLALSLLFKISMDSLLKVNLARLSELQLRDLEAGNDVYMTGSKVRVLAISVDKENKENSEFVPIKAKAGYRDGYANPEYIAALPKFNIPGLPAHASYRTFPITGNSMLPITPGSLVTGKYIENWQAIKPDTPCILILNGEADFVFKMVTVHKDGTFLLRSLNKEFQPYTLSAGEILEIWAFSMYHSKDFPQAMTDLEEIKEMLVAMSQRLS